MTQVWDVSVLVDGVGRILEVRGQANLHLGQDGKGLIGQSIINFVNDSDVEHFQGFFKKLRPVIAAPRCVVNLKTPAFGIRSYVMQAEPGNQLETYWMMFAAAGPGMPSPGGGLGQLDCSSASSSSGCQPSVPSGTVAASSSCRAALSPG